MSLQSKNTVSLALASLRDFELSSWRKGKPTMVTGLHSHVEVITTGHSVAIDFGAKYGDL